MRCDHNPSRNSNLQTCDECGAVFLAGTWCASPFAEVDELRAQVEYWHTIADERSAEIIGVRQDHQRLLLERDVVYEMLREYLERFAVAAGVSVDWEPDSTVDTPGTPKYNDRLARDTEEAIKQAKERADRLREKIRNDQFPDDARHALGHVVDCEDGCPQCARLAEDVLTRYPVRYPERS